MISATSTSASIASRTIPIASSRRTAQGSPEVVACRPITQLDQGVGEAPLSPRTAAAFCISSTACTAGLVQVGRERRDDRPGQVAADRSRLPRPAVGRAATAAGRQAGRGRPMAREQSRASRCSRTTSITEVEGRPRSAATSSARTRGSVVTWPSTGDSHAAGMQGMVGRPGTGITGLSTPRGRAVSKPGQSRTSPSTDSPTTTGPVSRARASRWWRSWLTGIPGCTAVTRTGGTSSRRVRCGCCPTSSSQTLEVRGGVTSNHPAERRISPL